MSDRPNPFGDLNDLARTKAPPLEKAVIQKVAEDNGFTSRQPQPLQAGTEKEAMAKRPSRKSFRAKVIPNKQLNVKTSEETIARFYRLAERLEQPLGEVFAQAVVALEKSLN